GIDQNLLVGEVLISFVGGHEEREAIHAYAKFPPPIDCPQLAEGNIQDQVLYNMLSTQPHKGLIIAMEYLKECVCSGSLDNVWGVLRLVQAVPLSHTGGPWVVKGDQRAALMAVSAYLGAIQAANLHYNSIVPHLLVHASHIIEKHRPHGYDFLLETIIRANNKWEVNEEDWGVDTSMFPDAWYDLGATRVSGSHLPRHSDSQTCCITKQIIKGPAYFLENGESVMGLNDALMWSKVHPYSPLGTGNPLNPF
ncbi:unnamed protein product, partial [Meganyctiphanes norvegica]